LDPTIVFVVALIICFVNTSVLSTGAVLSKKGTFREKLLVISVFSFSSFALSLIVGSIAMPWLGERFVYHEHNLTTASHELTPYAATSEYWQTEAGKATVKLVYVENEGYYQIHLSSKRYLRKSSKDDATATPTVDITLDEGVKLLEKVPWWATPPEAEPNAYLFHWPKGQIP
jgi:hypothetical protein